MRIIDQVEIFGNEVVLSYGGRALEPHPDDEGHDWDDEFLVDAIKARAALVDHSDICTEEYPSADRLIRPTDEFAYYYVSDAYLTGLINYTAHLRTIGIRRYEEGRTQEAAAEALEAVLAGPHFKYRDYGDDVVFVRECATYYWAFLYDMDCSDCAIARVRKWRGVDALLELFSGYFDMYDNWTASGKPRGWIS